jgi:hypothetical protein
VKDDPAHLWKRASAIEVNAKLTGVLAKTGEIEAALSTSRETLALMEQTTVEPTNAAIRGFFADTFADLGEAHATLAQTQSTPRVAACEMYRRCLAILHDMRDRGTLSGSDAAKPEAIAQKISECDSSLRE